MSLRGILKLLYDKFVRKDFPMLERGKAAPEFELTDHTGTVRRLSDYRGSFVVLWFFPKADTPG